MTVLEIIGGVIMLIASIFIICVVMMQESKQQNGLSALNGGSSDRGMMNSYTDSKTAFYSKLTKIMAIVFFVVALALNLIIHFGK